MCACSHPETDRAPCAHRAARAPEALLHTHPGHPPLLIWPSAQASLSARAQRPNRARSTSALGSRARRSTPCPCNAPRKAQSLFWLEDFPAATENNEAMRSFSEKDILSLIAKLVLRGVEQIFVGGVAWETTEGLRVPWKYASLLS
ncbi:uncharacterized protein [Zea mays]|uniref:uncharacterized protein isoform X3 n=1 Tax=Zea mays TaxID=4577 RepID=UPI0009AA0A3B|nr:uncharacterized protein LOC109942998 isoform X3 [Zea mays]XP_020401274.1 uncharacterized protein LOC109942998 isoform X3 [Zea mays]|eukprot:XP_020401263.1 uncharacterized protein LOC109942998 isoform X2 [Zea mays]